MLTINQDLFLSWVAQVFGGSLKQAAAVLGYSFKHTVAVAKGRRSLSRKFALRTKQASKLLTPDTVLTLEALFVVPSEPKARGGSL